jgi:hypothetical protein
VNWSQDGLLLGRVFYVQRLSCVELKRAELKKADLTVFTTDSRQSSLNPIPANLRRLHVKLGVHPVFH